MKNLKKLADECIEDLTCLGIYPHCPSDNFSVNYRAKNRWGQCARRNGSYYITISNRLLEDNVDDHSTKQTIMHELLHSCDNCMTHKGEWKRLAGIVNAKLGYHITRCTSASELLPKENIEDRPIYHNTEYVIRCTNCGKEFHYYRESRFVKAVMNNGAMGWVHSACGASGKFKMISYKKNGIRYALATCKYMSAQ